MFSCHSRLRETTYIRGSCELDGSLESACALGKQEDRLMEELGNLPACAPNCRHQVDEANPRRPKLHPRSLFQRRERTFLSPDRVSLDWIPGRQLHLTLAAKCAPFSDGKKGNSYRFAAISTARMVRSMRSVAKSMNGGRVVVYFPNWRRWRNWFVAEGKCKA